METDIDRAFDWLVMILSLLSGALMGLPETIELKKAVALGLVPMVLVLVVVWLFSHLTVRTPLQVVLKSYAWFHSSFLFLSFIFLFLSVTSPSFNHLFYHYAGQLNWVVLWVFLPLFLAMPFLFYIFMVLPKYRQVYADSKLLTSRTRQVSLYVLSVVTYILLLLVLWSGEGGIFSLFF